MGVNLKLNPLTLAEHRLIKGNLAEAGPVECARLLDAVELLWAETQGWEAKCKTLLEERAVARQDRAARQVAVLVDALGFENEIELGTVSWSPVQYGSVPAELFVNFSSTTRRFTPLHDQAVPQGRNFRLVSKRAYDGAPIYSEVVT